MRADSDAIYMEQLQNRAKEDSTQRGAENFDDVWDGIAEGIAQMRRWDPNIVFAAPDESEEDD